MDEHELYLEYKQRVQEILSKNPEFSARYDRMAELLEEKGSDYLPSGLSDEQAAHVAKVIKNELAFDLPEDYLAFIKLSNGFDNGFESGEIFGYTRGFFDYENCTLLPLNGGYVFGTYEDEGYYIYAAKRGIFYCFDRCSQTIERAFDTFSDLLDYFLGLQVKEGGIRYYSHDDIYDDEPDEIYLNYEYDFLDAQFVDDSEDDDIGYGAE